MNVVCKKKNAVLVVIVAFLIIDLCGFVFVVHLHNQAVISTIFTTIACAVFIFIFVLIWKNTAYSFSLHDDLLLERRLFTRRILKYPVDSVLGITLLKSLSSIRIGAKNDVSAKTGGYMYRFEDGRIVIHKLDTIGSDELFQEIVDLNLDIKIKGMKQ